VDWDNPTADPEVVWASRLSDTQLATVTKTGSPNLGTLTLWEQQAGAPVGLMQAPIITGPGFEVAAEQVARQAVSGLPVMTVEPFEEPAPLLDGGQSWFGPTHDAWGRQAFTVARAMSVSDQPGTLWIGVSSDGQTWARAIEVPTGARGNDQMAQIELSIVFRYWRVGYLNASPTTQKTLRIGSSQRV
jgi:hypothetical protein